MLYNYLILHALLIYPAYMTHLLASLVFLYFSQNTAGIADLTTEWFTVFGTVLTVMFLTSSSSDLRSDEEEVKNHLVFFFIPIAILSWLATIHLPRLAPVLCLVSFAYFIFPRPLLIRETTLVGLVHLLLLMEPRFADVRMGFVGLYVGIPLLWQMIL